MSEGSPPVVVVTDEQTDVAVDLGVWKSLAEQVLVDEGLGARAELNVTFVDRSAIADLNENHMGKSGPTDVLSFPLEDDAVGEGFVAPPDQPRLLGDVVICPAVVHAQAPDSPRDEMALMVVHGLSLIHISEPTRPY